MCLTNRELLPINIVDNESKKLVWQGWAETEVTKRRIDKDDMNKIVKSIFRKLDSGQELSRLTPYLCLKQVSNETYYH
jgi:hypothetical protein